MWSRSTALALIGSILCIAGCGGDDEADRDAGAAIDSAPSGADASDGAAADANVGADAGATSCDEDCSGHGHCVLVAGAPTCACDSGYYRVGLACLEDPCETGGTCYYFDADSGDDDADGSKATPWQTLAKVQEVDATLPPGAYVLFRRGRDWSANNLTLGGIEGTEEAPVTVGAYGPVAEPRPILHKVTIRNSSHVTLRDIESNGSTSGPCIPVSVADHVIVQDTTAHNCTSNGIHWGGNTSYGVAIDNLVYDVHANDALVVHSPTDLTEDNKVGDHFWIVDNRVPGPVAEQPVDIATGDDVVAGSRDIKIVGNVLARGNAGCVTAGHGTSVVWIVGNLLGNCPVAQTAFSLGVGGTHGANSGTMFQVRGNVVFWNRMSMLARGELPQTPMSVFERNTIVTGIGERTIWATQFPEGDVSFERNLLWTTGGNAHVALDGTASDTISAMDHNWYVPDTGSECRIDGNTLSEWQAATGFDTNSSCASVPGLSQPTQVEVDDFDSWTSPDFLAHFIPDQGWAGCADQIGAFDCDGSWPVVIEPFPDYDDNGGYGWKGPLIVQQRYPLPD